jgi:hypothetical protein
MCIFDIAVTGIFFAEFHEVQSQRLRWLTRKSELGFHTRAIICAFGVHKGIEIVIDAAGSVISTASTMSSVSPPFFLFHYTLSILTNFLLAFFHSARCSIKNASSKCEVALPCDDVFEWRVIRSKWIFFTLLSLSATRLGLFPLGFNQAD